MTMTATREIFLGRYQSQALLGEGGMGKVFLGRQLDNGREVVIKVMHDQLVANPKTRKAFEREMMLMMRFRHPYAVELFEASAKDSDKPCIIMEFVRGQSLSEIVEKEGKLSAEHMGNLLGQLCQVLQAAHDNGIIHRDLTLANVMVKNTGTANETVKVMDFGLASIGADPHIRFEKLIGDANHIGGGTPDFVSPEQVRGDEIDHRADLYSLGVLMYKCLVGYLPFERASSTEDILNAHLQATPPPFSTYDVNGAIPPGIEELVHRCLAKYATERPQTALDIAEGFGKSLGRSLLPDQPIEGTLQAAAPTTAGADPRTVMDQFESWMPEAIAVIKLRGFVEDNGGQIIESEPGYVRVRLPDQSLLASAPKGGFLSKLGFGKPPETDFAQLELRLEKKDKHSNTLVLTVLMKPERNVSRLDHPDWRDWCSDLCRELRAYLISR